MRENSVNRLETAWPRLTEQAESTDEHGRWSELAKSWEDNVEAFITDHPRLALASAVACGLLLGWMVKRK